MQPPIDWRVRPIAEAADVVRGWYAYEHDGRCQYRGCDETATHVATSELLHMRGLLCPAHANMGRVA